MAELFLGAKMPENRILVRKHERLRMELPADGITQELLVPTTDRKLGVVQMSIPPGFRGEDVPHSHPGEEVVLLLSGSLKTVVGGQTFELDEGDTLTYDASTPHWWSNESDASAVILAGSTPPSMRTVH